MNSFNHYSLGSVGQWLYSSVAGIELGAPGFSSVIFKPQPGGGITHARASYHSLRGVFSSAWTLEEGRFTLELTIPPNSTATVVWPCAGEPVTERESRQVLSKQSAGHHQFILGSGRYVLESGGVLEAALEGTRTTL